MSYRPRRKAARNQNYNEDQMYPGESYLDDSNQPQPQRPANKFVEPRSRIPQQRVFSNTPLVAPLPPQKKGLNLRSFLSGRIVSRRVKTSLCGSKRSCEIDYESYKKVLTSKRKINQKKRAMKQELKEISQKLESSQMLSKSSSPEFLDHFSHTMEMDRNSYQMSYSKPNMGPSNKNVTSKVAAEPVTTVKAQREETFKAVEDSEKISTAISSSEKSQNKLLEMRGDPENDLTHNEYNKDFIEPSKADTRETSQAKNFDGDMAGNNQSLLDEICDKNNEEYPEDAFLEDSLPPY